MSYDQQGIADVRPLAVITGGTSGIGLAIAKRLASKYRLALIYRSDAVKAQRALQDISDIQKDTEVFLFQEEIVDHDSADRVYKKILQYFSTSPTVLINAAGHTKMSLFMQSEFADFKELFESHFFGVVALTRIAVEDMYMKKYGRIINVSSISSLGNRKGITAYSSAKAAIDAFTRSLAIELFHRNITINSILPGLVDDKDASSDLYMSFKAHNRPLVPYEHIAELVCYLLGDFSAYITGVNYVIDGGSGRWIVE